MASVRSDKTKYQVMCKCGHTMRVRKRHFGRMCRCTQCNYPIYVTFDNVFPPMSNSDRSLFRYFSEKDVPVHWQPGDLIMEVYEVRGVLGHGGMGVVYQVYHRGWGVDLAVKSPLARFLPNKAAVELFEQECETWINLRPHPNSVCAFYVRRLGGIPRVFVEYVKGRALSQRIASKRLYDGEPEEALARLLDIAIQSAWGLEHAHREGVIHQDVKPSNILVSTDGIVKVTDFGVAKALRNTLDTPKSKEDSAQTPFGPGTPAYSSPDHLLDQPVSPKTDMWSWALSVLEMFAGGVCWHHGREACDALQHVFRDGPLGGSAPLLPENLADVLKQCFERDPAKRPESMLAVAGMLRELYSEITGHAYPREEPVIEDVTADMLNNRAVSLLDLGKQEESEALWKDVREKVPDHLAALYNCRLHRWRSGQLTDTEFSRELYKACKAQPGDWRPMYLLARVLMEMGDNRSAVQFLESIPKSDSNHREVAFALAMAQNKLQSDRGLIRKFHAHSTPITAVGLSENSKRALTGCAQGRVRIWECPGAEYVLSLEGHEGPVTAVAFGDGDQRVLSAGEDGSLRYWDAASGACLHVLKGHQGPIRAAILSNNGRRAISAGADGMIKVWHLRLGQCIQTLEGHTGEVLSLAFAGKESRLVSGSRDHTIRVWDSAEGVCLKTLHEGSHSVTSVAGCADPVLLLSASGQQLQVWDVEQGVVARSIRAHLTPIQCVSLNEDGRFALSATATGTIRLWDLTKGQCLRSLEGHGPALINRSGHYAISGSRAGRVLYWAVNCDEETLAAPFMICHRDTVQTP